ncbi:MAG: hypothetical protein P8J89_02900 [Phycisphaerales bacterium]|nr:hypothetical protein [Phycisphaerales bacterium]|tara:strand:+ start:2538 stop:3347 length:810 start_codon:yes stop_codon:yes gene_type:complete
MSWRDTRRSIESLLLLIVLGMAGFSCKSNSTSPVATPDERPRVSLPDVEGHGLAIRTHDTTEPLERIHEIIEDLPAERLTDDLWSSHGIEIIRIRESDQAFVHARLPASSSPGLRWHGQAITWRNMLPATVAINGRTILHGQDELEHDRGNLGISGRGWSMMTIDGPRILVELAPLIEVPGDDPDFLPSLRREFLIGPGDVLLLVGGSGVWPHPPPEDTSDEAMEESASRGTFGQLLFRRGTTDGTGQRVLMIVPRFGESRAEGAIANN